MSKQYDCIVVGGGFFGSTIALFLNEYFDDILVLEQETDIMQRASYNNQARVHMGYHYPRSIVTAFRSFTNFPKFTTDFRNAIKDDFDKYYAIAKTGSKVDSKQFYELYKNMGAPIEKASQKIKLLFNGNLIDEVFKVKEYAFDGEILKDIITQKIDESSCELRLNSKVLTIEKCIDGLLGVQLDDGKKLKATYVFNCTYSGINTILKGAMLPLLDLKHEITEMAVIELPEKLKNFSITIMDGPFFSIMPFPPRKLNTLSHVRYTPHASWIDKDQYHNGYELLDDYKKKSNYKYMINDAQRYIPILKDSIYVDSIFEVKTIQVRNESDDGRPILFTRDYGLKNFSNIMGGKIDNIYDILDTIKEARQYLGKKRRNVWSMFT